MQSNRIKGYHKEKVNLDSDDDHEDAQDMGICSVVKVLKVSAMLNIKI